MTSRLRRAPVLVFTVLTLAFAGCGGGGSSSGGGSGGTGGGGSGGLGGGTTPKLDGAACATSGTECAGGVCITLNANDQHEAGICTTQCTNSCSTGELCVSGFPDGNNYCLRSCTQDTDCKDGFVCVTDTGSNLSFCWVTADGSGGAGGGGGGGTGGTGGGGGSTGGHVDCVTPGCDTSLGTSGYCDGVTGATQACDCPNGSPSTSCVAATNGAANVWCCP